MCVQRRLTPNAGSSACTHCHSSCLTYSAADENSYTACAEGIHFLGTASGKGKCGSCGTVQSAWSGVANCAKCDKLTNQNTPAVCTECAEGYYLKTVGSTTSCVTDCGEGFFAAIVGSLKKCVRCNDNTNGGIADCGECSLFPSASRTGAILITCTKCSSDNLSPLKNECMTTCPAGTYADSNVCTPATRPAQNALMMQSPPAPPAIRGLYSTTVQRLGRARASRSAQESIWKTAPMDSAQLA